MYLCISKQSLLAMAHSYTVDRVGGSENKLAAKSGWVYYKGETDGALLIILFIREKKQLNLDHKKGGSTTREKNGSTASETQTVEGGSGMRPDWIIQQVRM